MPKFSNKTNIVTAFGRDSKIHSEYYYNDTKVALYPEDSIMMTKAVVTGGVIINSINLVSGACILHSVEAMGVEFSSKNFIITTAISTAFLSVSTAALFYDCYSSKTLEVLAKECQENMRTLHDDFMFTAEYVLDYASDLLY